MELLAFCFAGALSKWGASVKNPGATSGVLGRSYNQKELASSGNGLLCFMQARLLPPLPGGVAGVAVVDAGSVVAALLTLDA